MWFRRSAPVMVAPNPTTILADLLIFKIDALPVQAREHEMVDGSSLIVFEINGGNIKIKCSGFPPPPPHTYAGKQHFEVGMLVGDVYQKVEIGASDRDRIKASIVASRSRNLRKAVADNITDNQHIAIDMIERLLMK